MTTTAAASTTEIIHAYRHLYRALLRAVQFSKPARFVARDKLRLAFRRDSSDGGGGGGVESPVGFERRRIARTLEFLDGAARERGLEHRIVKNLLHVGFEREKRSRHLNWRQRVTDEGAAKLQSTEYAPYDATVRMLNDSMGLCLR